jgi:hypothetical protein
LPDFNRCFHGNRNACKGWEGKAIDEYEKFLELFKNADPVFTQVGDAKKRLAGLKGQ